MIVEDEKVEIVDEVKQIEQEKDEKEKEEKEEEEQKDAENEFSPSAQNVKYTYHTITIGGLFLLFFLILIIFIFGAFTIYNYINKDKIFKGIYINNIDVSGLTKEAANQKITSEFENIFSNDITLTHNDYTSYIKTSEINLHSNIEAAVNYAFQYGKSKNIFSDNFKVFSAMVSGINITPTIHYNEQSLEEILTKISSELPDTVVESAYYIEDSNLIITKGKPGVVIDVNATSSIIKEKLANLTFVNETIELKVLQQDPKEIDLNQIHNEVYNEPKDAYYTTDPYVVYPSSTGVDFKVSVEEANNLWQTAENECTIPLKTLYPKVTTNMIGQEAFPDQLSTFSTQYAASNYDRTTNLKLAANKINGTVLLPGEVFSYNGVVGERTISAGYKEAPIYQNGEVVPGLGGGICQISTTLYNAVLFANLEIVELYNHQFIPSYVGAGRDATVVYGVKDFKFKNTRNYPIKITCSVSGGIAKFDIWGLKQDNEYDVSVYATVNSRTATYIKSSTYRVLKQNGEVVKSENIINSTYKAH